MTAILGYGDGERVWMGGDSRCVAGWVHFTAVERKVYRRGELLIGGSGGTAAIQAVRVGLRVPAVSGDASDYVARVVVPMLRAALEERDAKMRLDDVATVLLIGFRGALYRVDPDLGVSHLQERLFAIGNGGDLAVGAFQTLRDHTDLPVEAAMLEALAIAGQHDMTVGPPYYVECL